MAHRETCIDCGCKILPAPGRLRCFSCNATAKEQRDNASKKRAYATKKEAARKRLVV